MRKTVITLLLVLAALAAIPDSASAAVVDYGMRVTSLMKEYSGKRDFQVVNLGRLGMSVVRTAIRRSGQKDAVEMLKLLKDVKRVSIADFSDCEPAVKNSFAERLSNVLTRDYLLVEAKNSGETVRIFAIPTSDGENISDLIISAPGSGALVCVSGFINVQDVAAFLDSHSK